MEINDDEEEGRAGGVHVADDPAAGNVTHDVFHRCEGGGQVVLVQVAVGLEVHHEEDAADDLDHQHQKRERAEVVPEVEVFRRVVFGEVFAPHFRQGEARVHPVQQCLCFAIGLVCHVEVPCFL